MIGETFGSYRVTGKIGEGGMGAVYLAEHTLLGRKAAVKVLLPEHSRNADLIARFFNEAKTAAGLKHPALVDVFDFGTHPSGSAYLVMDFLEGESLGGRLARVAPLPNELAMDLARQIARGMDAAHSQGIVHRDLKPDNIFLVPDADDPAREQVKILDFGIAKLLGTAAGNKSGATSTGMVLGTPLFMAPEQCRGAGVVDHRADIYSLGCILYLMLCARPPFVYEGVGELLAAHLHEPVTAPRSINPTIPEELERLVLKALAKTPDARYQTMAELAVHLGRLLGSPSLALPQTMALPQAPAPALPVPGPTTLSTAASRQPTAPDRLPRRRLILWPIAGAFVGGVAITAAALLRGRARTSTTGRSAAPSPSATSPSAASPSASPSSASPAALPPSTAADSAADRATDSAADAVPDGADSAAAVSPSSSATPAARVPPDAPAVPRQRTRAVTRPTTAARPDGELYARGVTLLARRDERGALEAFRGYLRGSGLPAAQRADAERHVLILQRKFGEVDITCEVAGADVTVDGRTVGRTPLGRSLLLHPGPHELVITKAGYAPVRRSFQIVAGERKPFFLRLAR